MSTSLKTDEINKLLAENRQLVATTSSPTCIYLLHVIRSNPGISLENIHERYEFFDGTAKQWIGFLTDVGLLSISEGRVELTTLGKRRLGLSDLAIEGLKGQTIPGDEPLLDKLPDRYLLEDILGVGATSITFRGSQHSTGIQRTVKIFRPGMITLDELKQFREKRKTIHVDVAIPDFISMGQFRAKLEGQRDPVELCCQVFEYENRDAVTLHEYVRSTPHFTRDFFASFVEHVGGALEAIERAGLAHGDLHARNILVIRRMLREPSLVFKVIDFAGGSSFNSLAFSGVSDLEMFKRHLIWLVAEVSRSKPGVSARELVGVNVERIIVGLRASKYARFADLLEDFHSQRPPEAKDYFPHPPRRPFEWLRVEFIPQVRDLYMLFAPNEPVLKAIVGSDNVIISGPRGCGKSHYLRVLNFWPEIMKLRKTDEKLSTKLEQIGYDHRRFFGILFECRVGEFKDYTPQVLVEKTFPQNAIRVLKHILILKIINRTLALIRQGWEEGVLIAPSSVNATRHFVRNRFPKIFLIGEPIAKEELIQYFRNFVTMEKEAEATWYRIDKEWDFLLGEPDLDEFYRALQTDMPEFAETQFFVLFDDVSKGRMDFEMQKVLNSIVTSATKRFCFKITCDKFMYTLDTSEGRLIDPFQDIIYVDLGDLSVKAQQTDKKAIREYIRTIVNSRLESWLATSTDIAELLGESQKPRDFLSALASTRKTRKNRPRGEREESSRAFYAGWNIIWQLSHGSIRTLFLMLDMLLSHLTGFDHSKPKPIDRTKQDKVVRGFSKQKFQSLLMLKGEFDNKPLGDPVSNVARTVGEVSRLYLRKWETGDPNRFYETITFERLDAKPLDYKATMLLWSLLEHDVFIVEGLTFSRSQIGLSERYDLNKIYSPCFEITYRVRNHLYLSKRKFEMLLLKPHEFVTSTRRRLAELTKPKKEFDLQKKEMDVKKQITLFDEDV